ncbi:TPA: hypothetical protein KV183_003466 [Morganella morganii]|nr:hypothetical protein [Morganella morganii]
MAKNDFLPFGISEGANVLSDQEYESLVARHNGFSSGVAKSRELNKVWRQSSVFTAILAQFIVDTDGEDLPDDGNLPAVKGRLVSALKEAFRGEMPAVPKTVQTTGGSTKDVMSQKAVTDAINNIKIPEVSDATTGRKGVVQLDDAISDSDTKVPPSKLIKAALADKPSTASMTLELNKKVNKSDVSDQLGNDKSKVPSLDLLTTELGKKAPAGNYAVKGESYSKTESDNKYQAKGQGVNANTASKGTAGWWKCGSTGIMHQWNTHSWSSGQTLNFTFPTPFPNNVVAIMITDSSGYQSMGTTNRTKTGFTLTGNQNKLNFSYFAIGY